MASSKVMPSTTSNPRSSDLFHHHHNHHHPSFPMIYGGDNPPPPPDDDAAAAEIALIDAAGAISAVDAEPSVKKPTVDDVWRDIVAAGGGGGGGGGKKAFKVEAPDEMMTLEAFLAKAGVDDSDTGGGGGGGGGGEEVEEGDIKMPAPLGMIEGGFGFDQMCSYSMVEGGGVGYVNGGGGGVGGGGVEVVGGRGKRRGGPVLETLDKAAQQRQRRMIKNRESAARSRERKQAYQVELESLAAKLEEENEQLLREKLMKDLLMCDRHIGQKIGINSSLRKWFQL